MNPGSLLNLKVGLFSCAVSSIFCVRPSYVDQDAFVSEESRGLKHQFKEVARETLFWFKNPSPGPLVKIEV